jgi:tetratricopeptide (TPR) repeat protein
MSAVQMHKPDAAISDLAFVWKAQPQNLHAALYLGRSLRQVERHEEAVRALEAAVQQSELEVDARYELARCHTRLRQPEQAMAEYRRVVSLHPGHADAAANLAFLLERDNQLDAADEWASRALELTPENTMALMTRATVDRRNGRLEAAVQRLQAMLQTTRTALNRSIVLNQLGQCLDQQSEFEQAFTAFSDSNRLLLEHHPYGRASDTGSYGFKTIESIRLWLSQNPPSAWSKDTESDRPDPVFLVGFPRSGTTLLDQALSAHSEIEVLEEIELFADVRRLWVEGVGLRNLPQMDAGAIRQARKIYWRALDAHTRNAGNPVVIDKLPLNLVYLFLVRRLFPESKILFIQRDPRDVCISCYFQSFDLQGAMPYFLDLAETAKYYDQVMRLADESLKAISNPVHTMRYEDLVTGFEVQMKAAVGFLGLAWEEGVLDYRNKARSRQIDTPSYQQVTQPLYTRSIGRWRNYAVQMEPHQPRLGQWVERFGYSSDSGLSSGGR